MAFRLAIDPGHGMGNSKPSRYDSGAVAGGHKEADINLAWSLTLKWMLTNAGFPVWMTRYDEFENAPLRDRALRANRKGCTHYLSIHCNSAGVLATGTETIVRDQVDRLFGSEVQRCAMAAIQRRNRGVKDESASPHGRLAVFGFDGPAALVEIGFITNPVDRGRMIDRDVRIHFAEEFTKWVRGQVR